MFTMSWMSSYSDCGNCIFIVKIRRNLVDPVKRKKGVLKRFVPGQ